MARYLAGSEVSFEIPGLGVFHGPNLTPDKETGLGSWTQEQIVKALQTGQTPDGRELAPIMPWRAFANLSKADANGNCCLAAELTRERCLYRRPVAFVPLVIRWGPTAYFNGRDAEDYVLARGQMQPQG